MSGKSRPHVPNPLKRQVRQKCGFGCVICGIPIYHIDHIDDFARTRRHEVENLTLLCSTHHQQKTAGTITPSFVALRTARPANLERGRSAPHRVLEGLTSLEIEMGTNIFTSAALPFWAVTVGGCGVLGLEHDGEFVLLTADFRDEQNRPVLQIYRNEVIFSTSSWDVEMTGKTLTIRDAPRRILLRVCFNPAGVAIDRLTTYLNGAAIKLGSDGVLQCGGVTLSGVHMSASVGMAIGSPLGVGRERHPPEFCGLTPEMAHTLEGIVSPSP